MSPTQRPASPAPLVRLLLGSVLAGGAALTFAAGTALAEGPVAGPGDAMAVEEGVEAVPADQAPSQAGEPAGEAPAPEAQAPPEAAAPTAYDAPAASTEVGDQGPSTAPGPAPSPAPAFDVQLDTEYRLRTLRVEPIELNGEDVRELDWTEQRFRVNTALKRPGLGSLNVQLDVLGGVLLGDNGSFLGTPASNAGVSLSAKRPNITRWDVGLVPGSDPLDRRSYVPVLRPAELFGLNFLYADVALPVGLLRIGRQPLNYGATITAHDGGRHNRWGVSQFSDSVDRVLFATKLDQVWGVLRDGKNHVPDASQDHGLIWGLFYDFMKQDSPAAQDADLRQLGTNVQLRRREASWWGLDWKRVQLSASAVRVSNDRFDSRLWGFPMLLEGQVEDFGFKFGYMHIRGQSREIAEGFAALANTEAGVQDLRMHGAQAVLDWRLGPLTLTLEGDYASGDDQPRSNDPITSYSFARDMNVGLLLFEHVLAFESARSVAVGVENLAGLDMASFPLTEVRSEGRFHNALALFPQARLELWERGTHRLHARAGVLMAWAAAPLGAIDPIMTSLSDVGGRVEDFAVNFHGGRPGRFYGTELDGQLGYRLGEHFVWTVEGAVLFPGNALHDEHGQAVRSFLVENRLEVLF